MPGELSPKLGYDKAYDNSNNSTWEYDTKFTTVLPPDGGDEAKQIDCGESTTHHTKPAYATPAQNLKNTADNLAHFFGA